MQVKSFADLEKFIEEDLTICRASSVRYINVECLVTWVKIKNLLIQKTQKQIMLSDYCAEEDYIANMSFLLYDLALTTENTVVLPLSEHLRINNNVDNTILSRISSVDTNRKVHIYIPMYRMKNSLEKLCMADPRLRENVIFLDEIADDDYSLTIISNAIEIKISGNNIYGIKAYLKYWEDNPNKPIILHTNNAIYYKDSIFADNVIVLISAYDIIQYHDLLPQDICENNGDDWQWKKLLEFYKYGDSLEAVCEREFECQKFNSEILFSKWKQFGDFHKWLLWLWAKTSKLAGYVGEVLVSTKTWLDFYPTLIEDIQHLDPNKSTFLSMFVERKQIIYAMQVKQLTNQFWTIYFNTQDTIRMYWLTDITQQERDEFISIIRRMGLTDRIKELIHTSYPMLSLYFSDYIFTNDCLTNYFRDYKNMKLANMFDESFIQTVNTMAEKKGTFWSTSHRDKVVSETYKSGDIILWVDGLDASESGFMEQYLATAFQSIYAKFTIVRADLPTVTSNNKGFIESRKIQKYKYGQTDLDEMKHSGMYPEYINSEIEILADIIRIAVELTDTYNKVLIVSDHGTSRGAVLANKRTYTSHDTAVVKRLGRYCIDTDHTYEKDINVCIDLNENHIIANYDRFSQSGNLTGEIHGGATLEEVLTPFVVLSKMPISEKVTISVETPIVKQQNALVRFKLNQEFSEIFAIIESEKYKCIEENKAWYFIPEIGKKDHYTVKLFSSEIIGQFDFVVEKGLTKNKKFDI